ncbi:hypothetical protein, partial [Streptomyces sp. P17]|uniref:hypothetical protein n=1 Tax=Streptomyces sp. P17 TaxID=3074716 RepID=UPI0028F3EF47
EEDLAQGSDHEVLQSLCRQRQSVACGRSDCEEGIADHYVSYLRIGKTRDMRVKTPGSKYSV